MGVTVPFSAIDRLDPFEVYRWFLAIVGTSYSVVLSAHSISNFISGLYQIGPRGPMLRRYLVVQVLRLRMRRFAGDLIQLGILAIVLIYLIKVHQTLRVFEL